MTVPITYYLQSAQATPMAHPLHKKTSGYLIAPRTTAKQYYLSQYPNETIYKLPRHFPQLSRAYSRLKKTRVLVEMNYEHGMTLRFKQLKRVMAFHGTHHLITDHEINETPLFSALLLNNKTQLCILKRAGSRVKCPFYAIGYLPFESFPDRTPATKKRLKQKYGFDNDQPVIVYATARRSVSSWSKHALSIVKQAPQHMNLYLRPHPNQIFSIKPEEKKQNQIIFDYCQQRGNAIIDPGKYHLPELLCIADLIISDGSSPAEEALFYDVPQLFADTLTPKSLKAICLKQGIHPEDIDNITAIYRCGLHFSDEQYTRWDKAINDALHQADRFQSTRLGYFEEFFFNKREGIAKAGAEIIRSLL